MSSVTNIQVKLYYRFVMSREEQDMQFGPVSVVWGCLTSDEGGPLHCTTLQMPKTLKPRLVPL